MSVLAMIMQIINVLIVLAVVIGIGVCGALLIKYIIKKNKLLDLEISEKTKHDDDKSL